MARKAVVAASVMTNVPSTLRKRAGAAASPGIIAIPARGSGPDGSRSVRAPALACPVQDPHRADPAVSAGGGGALGIGGKAAVFAAAAVGHAPGILLRRRFG